jgi:saccharopine dehydrogenase (NAD+, L-lysine-forming)
LRRGAAREITVDVSASEALDAVVSGVDLVVNTVGPFTRLAAPLIEACLRARVPYVDVANELEAVLALLDRDAEANRRSVTLVTGAGFGVVATETLALLLARSTTEPLHSVQVAAAPAVAYASPGVQTTVAETLAQGGARYLDGRLVRTPLGEGATLLDRLGGVRRVIPVPVGDLVAAQRATRAPNAVAYAPAPAERPAATTSGQELRSYAWAAGSTDQGHQLEAQLTFGEGFRVSAVIAAEVAVRLLAGARPGAWTPGQLFGPELALACGAAVRQDQPCRT